MTIRRQSFQRGDSLGISSRINRLNRRLLYLFLFSLAFMRPQFNWEGLGIVPSDVLAASTGGLVLASVALRWRRWRWDNMFGLLIAYFLAMVLSAFSAEDPLTTFLPRLLGEAYLLFLPALIFNVLESPTDIRNACLAWIMGVGAVTVLAVWALLATVTASQNPIVLEMQHRFGSLPLGPFVRFRLAYENPNMLGAYLSASAMLVLLALTYQWIPRRMGIVLLCGVFLSLTMTFSAGIGAALLGGGIWAWLHLRVGRRKVLGVALLYSGIGAGLAFIFAQLVTPLPYPNPAFAFAAPGGDFALYPSSRLRVWIDASATFLTHPLTGIGIGKSVADVWFEEPGGYVAWLRDAHNVMLNIAAQCGAIGVFAFGAIMVAIWRRSAVPAAHDKVLPSPSVALGLGVMLVLAYQGIGGSFEDARFVWAMVGLLLVASHLSQRERDWKGDFNQGAVTPPFKGLGGASAERSSVASFSE